MRVRLVAAALLAATLAAGGCGGGTAPSADWRSGQQPAAADAKPAGEQKQGTVPATLTFTGTTLDGKAFDAASLAGRPTVLWFWAPWFGAFGLAVAPAAGWIQERLPWVTVGLGVVLIAVGAWLAAGRSLPAPWRGPRAPELRRTLPSMALFGAAYAAASLSCTIGPFLAIVVASMRAGSTGAGVGLFLGYAAGMGLAVGAAALAVGLLRTSLLRAVRRAGSAISRLGGVLLLLAGAYVAYYGWYEIRLSADRSAVDDPVVAAAGQIQHSLSSALSSAGVEVVAAVFAVLLAAALAARRLTARSEVREQVRDGAGEERPQLSAGVGGHGTEPA